MGEGPDFRCTRNHCSRGGHSGANIRSGLAQSHAPSAIKSDDKVNIVNTAERKRLVWTTSNEPTHSLEVILKCGVCLALLALLIVIGSAEEQGGVAQEARSSAAHPASVAKSSSAAAHRKEVFDGRRARFEGNASERDIAGPALATHAEVIAP
jgi:hypothetical protein